MLNFWQILADLTHTHTQKENKKKRKQKKINRMCKKLSKFNQNATVCNGITHKKVLKSKQSTVHHSYTLMILPHTHTHTRYLTL